MSSRPRPADRSSSTARLAALFRTVLSAPAMRRAIDDPYAHFFLNAPMRLMAAVLVPPVIRGLDYGLAGLFTVVAARTHFYDEAMRQAMARGVRQIVILAAGYDSRALRLGEPGVRFFEVDLPATQDEKRARLASMNHANSAVFVPLDFATGNLATALGAAGHDPQAPTFFLWEGCTMYLHEQDVRQTLRALAALSVAGSELAFDAAAQSLEGFSTSQRMLGLAGRWIVAVLGEPLRFLTDPQSIRAVVSEEGFTVREVRGTEELFARYLTTTFLNDPRQPLEYAVLATRTLTA
jgi:methyltransferase (TIGR00027 family)